MRLLGLYQGCDPIGWLKTELDNEAEIPVTLRRTTEGFNTHTFSATKCL